MNFYIKENNHSESEYVEVYFCDSGFSPLFNSELNKNTFYYFKENFSIGDIKDINVDINIDKNKKIRIWCSHINIQEYINLLYFCYKFNGKDISVVFTDDYSPYIYSIGASSSSEVSKLLTHEHILTIDKIESYKNEWLKLVKENAPLRIFNDKKVISVDFNYLKEYILNNFDEDIYVWIGKLMANDNENNFSSSVWKELINEINNYN